MIFTRHKLGLHKMTTISRIQNDKLKLRNNLNDLLSSIRQMNIKSVTKANKEYQRQHPQGVWLPDDVWGVILEFMLGTDKKFKPPYERWRPSLRMRQFFPGEVYHGLKDGVPAQMLVLKRDRYSEDKAGHRIHYIVLQKCKKSYYEIEMGNYEGRIRTAWVRQYAPRNRYTYEIYSRFTGLVPEPTDEVFKNKRYGIEFKAQNMLCAWNDTAENEVTMGTRLSVTPDETRRRRWLQKQAGHYKGNNRLLKMRLERDGSVKTAFVGDKIKMNKRNRDKTHKIYRWIKFNTDLKHLQRWVRQEVSRRGDDYRPQLLLH